MKASDFLDAPDAASFLDDTPSLGEIPGTQQRGDVNVGKKTKRTQEDFWKGVGEAGLNMGTGLVAGVAAPVLAGADRLLNGGDWEKKTAAAMESLTYQPRTEAGQDYAGRVGKVVNNVLLPLGPMHLGTANTHYNTNLRRMMPEITKPIDVPPTAGGIADRLKSAESFLDETPTPPTKEKVWTPSELKEWRDTQERFAKYKAEQEAQAAALARQTEAQRIIEERQKALELDTARQTSLDMNAAERARQDAAPTGYAEWVERQRQDIGGDPRVGDPLELGPSRLTKADQYPDVNTFPDLLKDAPYQYEGGIDYTHPRDAAAAPIEAAAERGVPEPDPFNRVSTRQNANRMAEPLEEHIRNLERSNSLPDELTRMEEEGNIPIQPNNVSGLPKDNSIPARRPRRRTNTTRGGLGRSQRGGVDFKAVEEGVRKLGQLMSSIGEKLENALTPKERVVIANIGNTDYIPEGDTPANIIKAALAEGKDGKPLFTNFQSGLRSAAEKTKSAVQSGVERHLAWAEKTANKYFRDYVKPIEEGFSKLSPKELADVTDVLKLEMFDRERYTPEQLRAAGLTDKGIAAYTKLRETFDNAIQTLNESRLSLGLDPITPAEAYFSSQWTGNWHMPVHDANGRLVWYIKTETRGEATSATRWFKQNHPEYTLTKPEYKSPNNLHKVPGDVSDAYTRMLELFKDTPVADEIALIMKQYKAQQDVAAGNFKVHFENKANVRGFLGDRPWLTKEQNAHQAAKAQVEYLKSAYRWAPLQEAYAQIKEVITNPELVKTQPNNIEMAKLYTVNAMGVTNNLFKGLENGIAKGSGISPSLMRQFVGDLKTLTYLQQLGMSVGYAIATPTQAFMLGPSLHMKLSGEGYKYNIVKAAAKSAMDTALILKAHQGFNLTGKMNLKGLSPLAKDALRYAEDNGIITVNLFDEYANLGEHKGVAFVKDTIGATISFPEKVARTATFMSFVHHLNDSKMFTDKLDMFRRAEEMTDLTLTKFSRSGRPLMVDQAGLLGELAYTYKSPIFNHYNTLGILARDGNRTGNYKPFLMAMAMTGVLGGVFGMPGFQEVDGLLNIVKDGVAYLSPEDMHWVNKINPKTWVLENLPDVAAYGAVSAATGTQMASRFSTQVVNPENPLSDSFPAVSQVQKAAGFAPLVASGFRGEKPNETKTSQALFDNLPPVLKGIVEVNGDQFKAGKEGKDGRQGYYNPNRLEDRSLMYRRTDEDESKRKLGLTSLEEARTKDVRYANSKENKRFDTARNRSMTKLFDAIVRKNPQDVKTYAKAYINNYGDDASFEKDFNNALEDANFTPEERSLMKANTWKEIEAVKRQRAMSK